jgi:predicted PurR-regulated permease PerM
VQIGISPQPVVAIIAGILILLVPRLLNYMSAIYSMVFWGWILGPIGMILSVPMTSLVKIALESFEGTRGLAIMMASDSEIEWIEKLRRRQREGSKKN